MFLFTNLLGFFTAIHKDTGSPAHGRNHILNEFVADFDLVRIDFDSVIFSHISILLKKSAIVKHYFTEASGFVIGFRLMKALSHVSEVTFILSTPPASNTELT